MKWLWPIRTGQTLFDYWSIMHLWEVFERFAEQRWPQLWQSPESILNSLVSDAAMCLLGLYVAFYGFDFWRP